MLRRAVKRAIKPVLIMTGVVAGATLIGRRLGYNFGTNTVVRCRQGHLFTTVWIPGVKLKELDLIVARVQRCPVGQCSDFVFHGFEDTKMDSDVKYPFSRCHN